MLITFIYSLFNNNTKYYGKFVGNISYLMYTIESNININDISIINLIKIELVQIIQKQYKMSNINLEDINLGIMSVNESYNQYSLEEKNIFDVLIIYNDSNKIIYVDGIHLKYNLIETSELTESEVSSNDIDNDYNYDEDDNCDTIINQIIELD